MHRDQRHDQAVLLSQADDNRRQQRGDNNVVRRRRQPHAEDQAENGREDQDQQDLSLGQELDQFRQHKADAGLRYRAHNDTSGLSVVE